MLENRPDVKAAELALASAYYTTNQARSAFYPGVNITGTLGWTNGSNGTVISNPAVMLWNAIGSFAKERREILSNLCTIFDVEGIDKAKLLTGLANEEFSDFEDCLQMECAKSYGAEYIVTRNVSDYSVSDIKAILPSEYLGL